MAGWVRAASHAHQHQYHHHQQHAMRLAPLCLAQFRHAHRVVSTQLPRAALACLRPKQAAFATPLPSAAALVAAAATSTTQWRALGARKAAGYAYQTRPVRKLLELLDAGDTDGALELVHAPSFRVFHRPVAQLMLDLCDDATQCARVAQGLEFLHAHQRELASVHLHQIVEGMAAAGDVWACVRVLRIVPGDDVERFRRTCSVVMRASESKGDHAAVWAVFDVLKNNRTPLTRPLYNLAILASARAREKDKAFEMARDMANAGIAFDTLTYNNLLAACSRVHDPPTALRTFADMKQAGVRPDVVTFNCLVDVCARAGECDRALALFKEMVEMGLMPDTITANCVIKALSTAQRLKEAQQFHDRMQSLGISPDAFTYMAMLRGCALARDSATAMKLLKYVTDHEGSKKIRARVDLVLCNAVLHACDQAGAKEHAQQVHKLMVARELHPDTVSYNSLLGVMFHTHDLGQAEALLREMTDKRVPQSIVTHEIVLRGLANNAKPVAAVRYLTSVWHRFDVSATSVGAVVDSVARHLPNHQATLAELLRLCNERGMFLPGRLLGVATGRRGTAMLPELRDVLREAWLVRCRSLLARDDSASK